MTQQPAPDYGQPAGYDVPGSRYVQDPSGYQPGYQNYDEGYEQSYGQCGGGQPGSGGYVPADHVPADYVPADEVSYHQLSASLTLDDGSNRYYQLTEGATVVGRGQEAQFRLPDTGVSRRHVEINWDGQTAMLADLGSTNGTTVNGTPVQTWQLVDGDVVRVGQSRLVFRTQG
jgi:FHA domain